MTENTENNQPMEHPPHIMHVYYAEEPVFDYSEMEAYLVDMDESGPSEISIQDNENGFSITFDKIDVRVMKMPEPDQGFSKFIMNAQQFPEDFRTKVSEHKVVYQVVVGNVMEAGPLESQISLLKVGAAMCDQDGLCIAFPFSGTILPAGLLEEAANTIFGDDSNEGKECDCGEEHEHDDCCDKGESISVWDLLRNQGQPQMLLMNIAVFRNDAQELWLISRGFTFCGLPDILVKLDSEQDVQLVAQFVEASLAFQISNRQMFGVGSTIDFDENITFSFSNPPNMQVPMPTYGCLLAVKSDKRQAKPKIEIVRS